ncbi:DUF805 domain-containing protein [Deinococcus lacus]|uniref:DUF805 domain-containing protein n=1 Tax=Deinococcus lacus TaxID=392561 RepID=A0ABW1YCL0_9DEIO
MDNSVEQNPIALVKTAFTRKYADFSGRARRSEFWFFQLAVFLLAIAVGLLLGLSGASDDALNILTGLLSLLILVPSLAVTVRRLHDTGRSGWWYLIGLIPVVGTIALLIFSVQDSQMGSNKWGPSPKEPPVHDLPSPRPQTAGPVVPATRMGLEADMLPPDPSDRKYGR